MRVVVPEGSDGCRWTTTPGAGVQLEGTQPHPPRYCRLGHQWPEGRESYHPRLRRNRDLEIFVRWSFHRVTPGRLRGSRVDGYDRGLQEAQAFLVGPRAQLAADHLPRFERRPRRDV